MSEHDKKFFQCNIDELDWWEFFRKFLTALKKYSETEAAW